MIELLKSIQQVAILKICCCSVAKSCLTLCNPMDYIARQVLLPMEFSRQEYWSGSHLLLHNAVNSEVQCCQLDLAPAMLGSISGREQSVELLRSPPGE